MSARELVLQVLEQLPEDAEIDEIVERLYFLHALQQRLDRADMEQKLTLTEVRQRLARWRV